MNLGLISGVITNLLLWLLTSEWLFWFWWNITGALTTFLISWIMSIVAQESQDSNHEAIVLEPAKKEVIILIAYFVIIVLASVFIDKLF